MNKKLLILNNKLIHYQIKKILNPIHTERNKKTIHNIQNKINKSNYYLTNIEEDYFTLKKTLLFYQKIINSSNKIVFIIDKTLTKQRLNLLKKILEKTNNIIILPKNNIKEIIKKKNIAINIFLNQNKKNTNLPFSQLSTENNINHIDYPITTNIKKIQNFFVIIIVLKILLLAKQQEQ